jgi:hypothetical protein
MDRDGKLNANTDPSRCLRIAPNIYGRLRNKGSTLRFYLKSISLNISSLCLINGTFRVKKDIFSMYTHLYHCI